VKWSTAVLTVLTTRCQAHGLKKAAVSNPSRGVDLSSFSCVDSGFAVA
jgi:hypothetical protein